MAEYLTNLTRIRYGCMTNTNSKYPAWLLAAYLCAFTPLVNAQDVADLPEMGDSSSTLLSMEDELRIGKEMMQQLDKNGAIIHDPIVDQYIGSLGRSLSSAAVTDRNHFQFFVVNAGSINAFAMPGGYIGIHAGLILASKSESELAAVLAHEIAHVTQHHIARGVEKANQMNLPMTAAVIAAILLGGGDPQVANAALAASVGAAQQMQLDFTRTNEKEADRVGMQLLAVSDYDPRGMSDFFARLQSETRYQGDGVPEFLRTHPVTTKRIAEAEDRARQYPMQMKGNSIHYLLTKARLLVALSDSPQMLLKQQSESASASAPEREAQRYLQALVMQRTGDIDAARKLFTTLLKQHPERIAYIYGLGELEASQGMSKRATQIYQQGLKQYPGNDVLTLAQSRNLIANGEHAKAQTLLDDLLRDAPANAEAYRLLAKLESEKGNLAASYLARAKYYYLKGEPHSAIDQLNMAKRLSPLPDYYASRIDAELQLIKKELALHKKNTR